MYHGTARVGAEIDVMVAFAPVEKEDEGAGADEDGERTSGHGE